MKERKKPEKFWLPHGMPSDDREFAFSSRIFPKASQIQALYKLWHYQSIDNSVMDRFGKLIRCAYSWYSGRYHKVIRGQDLLGIVLTIHHLALPLHLLFCPKQGRD